MKKLTFIFIAVCICLSACVLLASCGHEHTWDGGKITTPATESADGVKTFTCTECGETKTEAVKYSLDTAVSEAEWKAAFSAESVMSEGSLNVTVTMNTSWDGESVHLFADGKHKSGDFVEEGWDIDRFLSSDYSVHDLFGAYSEAVYDSAAGVYTITDGADEVITVRFLNNKLVSCTISFLEGTEDEEIWTTSYSDVGTTVIAG